MKAIPWLTGTIGSYVGWWLGDHVGLFTAFALMVVGGAVGGYYGRKWVLEHL